jgi:hypothetical protein
VGLINKNMKNFDDELENVDDSYDSIILDEFHYHEALDRTYLFTDMIDSYLLKHPVYQKNVNLKLKLEAAIEYLAELYQEIGAESFKLFDK